MQCREERLEFYRQHDIGFVARPPHGKAGFLRAGRFKKASNMNYCLEISRQVETIMLVLLFPMQRKHSSPPDMGQIWIVIHLLHVVHSHCPLACSSLHDLTVPVTDIHVRMQ